MKNKKTLILSIIGVLILVIAVVGVSFAMYTFTGTGTTENVIQTGTITMSFDPSNSFELKSTYPMSDSKGITQEKTNFGVKADWGSTTMTIKYDIGIKIVSEGTHLTDDYIKIALLKDDQVIIGDKNQDEGSTLKAGVKLSSLASTKGPNNLITEYGLTGGTLTVSGTVDNYSILAYVSDDYKLDEGVSESETNDDSNHTIKKETTPETFKFKVTIAAEQQ